MFTTEKTLSWLKSLLVAVISGTASAIVGIGGGQVLGVDIPFNALGPIAASAALFNLATYLSKSPLPES